jgi:hypothetical protein
MSTAEEIYRQAQALPDAAQRAVLQIVALLSQQPPPEEKDWSRFSFSAAMAGMEDEEWPDYTTAPNFEKWR